MVLINRLLIIGIDALAPALLEKYEPYLPNFTKLRQVSPEVRLKSIFPVDSMPAWISVFTGLNPAKHGIIYAFDVFKSMWQDILKIDVGTFQGRTFWDYASHFGKKVCVLYPPMAFPPWPVNGVMVCKSLYEREVQGQPPWLVEWEVQTYPPELVERYKIPRFVRGTTGLYPGNGNLKKWVKITEKIVLEEAKLALRVSLDYQWDLFFVVFTWLDPIQHIFWKFQDESDPKYPRVTPYKNVIRDFYQLFDSIIGNFMESHPQAMTIVLSDHGFGMRPTKTVNINEVLRRKGLLSIKSSFVSFLVENIKRKLLDAAYRYGLDYWLVNLGKAKPLSSTSKNIYMSTASIDAERSLVFLSSFIGAKSYAQGGIEIKRENLKTIDYELLRTLILRELLRLKTTNGQQLVKWASRREELYRGPYIAKYPDVIFELREGYGGYWGVYCPLIGTSYEHNLASGGHKKDAVFLISNTDKKVLRKDISVMDVAPIVLDLIGVKHNFEFDGNTIFQG